MKKFPSISSPSSPKPYQGRKKVIIQRVQSAFNIYQQEEADFKQDLLEFKKAMKVTEEKYGAGPSQKEFCGSIKSNFKDMFEYVNPSLEKNFSRMTLTNAVRPPEPSQHSLPSPISHPQSLMRPQDLQLIDKHYEHSAASLAINKLPLPGTPQFEDGRFNRKKFEARKSTKNVMEEVDDAKRYIFNIMPKEETQTLAAESEPAAHPTFAMTFYWMVKQVSGSRPESREGAALLLLDRKLYLFGGQSMIKRNDTRVFNPDTNVWSMVSTYYSPKGRIGHSLCPYKNQLFLYGGWSHYSQRLRMRRCFKKTYVLTLDDENKWQRYSCGGDIPKSRRDHAMACLGSSMFVFGGIDAHSQVLKSCRVLDMDTLRWVKIPVRGPPKPGRRSGATLTAVFPFPLFNRWDFSIFSMPQAKLDSSNSYSGFYLFGGMATSNALGDIWVLKISEPQFEWQELTPTGRPPTPRYSHTATYIGQMLIIYGGRNDSFAGAAQGSLSDIVILRLDMMKWDHVNMAGSVGDGRWGHCAVGMGSKMIIFGGLNYKAFLPADVLVIETDQNLVTDYIKIDEEKEERLRLKRRYLRKTTST